MTMFTSTASLFSCIFFQLMPKFWKHMFTLVSEYEELLVTFWKIHWKNTQYTLFVFIINFSKSNLHNLKYQDFKVEG